MMQTSIIIYLTGKPGVGKYTIAKELAKNYSFIVCDNQLINNPIFELLQYDGYAKIPDFAWDIIDKIREVIFEFLTKAPEINYVLTNCLAETKEDRNLYEQVSQVAKNRDSIFFPVQLTINKDEHVKRITNEDRRKRWKSIDHKDVEDNAPLLSITHPNFIQLDVSTLTAENAAKIIMEHVYRNIL